MRLPHRIGLAGLTALALLAAEAPWPVDVLGTDISGAALAAAEARIKTTGMPAETACRAALFELAGAAKGSARA